MKHLTGKEEVGFSNLILNTQDSNELTLSENEEPLEEIYETEEPFENFSGSIDVTSRSLSTEDKDDNSVITPTPEESREGEPEGIGIQMLKEWQEVEAGEEYLPIFGRSEDISPVEEDSVLGETMAIRSIREAEEATRSRRRDMLEALGIEDMDNEEADFFNSTPGFMIHEKSSFTSDPMVIFLPNEAFNTTKPDSLDQLSSDSLRIHFKDLVDNLRAASQRYMRGQREEVEKLKESLGAMIKARYNKYRAAVLKTCNIEQGGDDRSISIQEPVHPTEDEAFIEWKENMEEHISDLEQKLGNFSVESMGIGQMILPNDTTIISRAYGSSGIPTGYFFIMKINNPDFHFGDHFARQITVDNRSFYEDSMGRKNKMTKVARIERLKSGGKFSYTHITTLCGGFGSRGSLTNAIDQYCVGKSEYCNRAFGIGNSEFNRVVRERDENGNIVTKYINPIHPYNIFNVGTAIQKAKESLGGLHPKQSDPSNFFRTIEYNGNQKVILNFRPEDAVVVSSCDIDPALGKSVLLPKCTIKDAYSGFEIVGENLGLPPEEILKNLGVDQCCRWDGGTESYVTSVTPEDIDNLKKLPEHYRKLIESQMSQSDGGEDATFMIKFPREVVDRAYCLRKRSENAVIVGKIFIEIDRMFEKMEKIRQKIQLNPDTKERKESLSRIKKWFNPETNKIGLDYFLKNSSQVYAKTADERELFQFYVTWLSAKKSLLEKRLELSKLAWKDFQRSNVTPEVFSIPTKVGMEWYQSLSPEKCWPEVCHHSIDGLTTYANCKLFKQRGYQGFLALIPGKPTADCVLLEDIFSSSWRFNPGLHPNVMIGGPNSASKSYVIESVSEVMWRDEIVQNVNLQTEKAYNTGQDRLYLTMVQEEAQSHMTGMKDGKEMNGGDEQTKNRMTKSLIVTIQCWVDENGERISTLHYSRCMETDIVLTNKKIPPPDSPLRSRYMIFSVILDEKPDDTKISDYAHILKAAKQEKETAEWIHTQKLHNFYTFLLMRWNEMLLVDDPTMDACVTVTKLAFQAMKDAEVIPKDVAMRTRDMIIELARVRTFKNAVWREFFTEHGLLNHHLRRTVDGEIDERLLPAPFHPDVFITHVAKHLHCTPEIAVDSATACAQTFAPLISQKVLQYIKGLILTREVDVIDSDPRFYTLSAPRLGILLEKIAGTKMNKETVSDALRELSLRTHKTSGGKSIPYCEIEDLFSGKRATRMKICKFAIDRVSQFSSVDLETKILEVFEDVLCHCFAIPDQRLITSFFFTMNDEKTGRVKRWFDLNAVINTKKLPKIHSFKNPIRMGKMETALFHTRVKSGADREYRMGNKQSMINITRDFELAALMTHQHFTNCGVETKVHSAIWAKYCVSLRKDPRMPDILKRRFKPMIKNYPYSEAWEDIKRNAREFDKEKKMSDAASIIKNFALSNFSLWNDWTNQGKVQTLGSLVKQLKNHELKNPEFPLVSPDEMCMLESSLAITESSNVSKFGSYGSGTALDNILPSEKEFLSDYSKYTKKELKEPQPVENDDRDEETKSKDREEYFFRQTHIGLPSYRRYWEEFGINPNDYSKAHIQYYKPIVGEQETRLTVDAVDPSTGLIQNESEYPDFDEYEGLEFEGEADINEYARNVEVVFHPDAKRKKSTKKRKAKKSIDRSDVLLANFLSDSRFIKKLPPSYIKAPKETQWNTLRSEHISPFSKESSQSDDPFKRPSHQPPQRKRARTIVPNIPLRFGQSNIADHRIKNVDSPKKRSELTEIDENREKILQDQKRRQIRRKLVQEGFSSTGLTETEKRIANAEKVKEKFSFTKKKRNLTPKDLDRKRMWELVISDV